LALVFVLYAYGGWNDAAFVAAEVRNPKRNLPRALFTGIAGITAIYVIINLSILWSLGFDAARQSHAPAADVLERAVGPSGGRLVSVLVAISALGAINGMILTGSRVYATLGADYRVFAWLGRWNDRVRAPVNAVASQAIIALLFILTVGTTSGRNAIDAALTFVRLEPIPWETYFGGFETLLASTAPVFWSFFLLTGVSLVVLRYREPDRARPFRVPFYPLPVIVFCLTCAFMLYSSTAYAKWLTLIGVIPLAIGVPLYAVTRSLRTNEQ
jgi:amino acid transporter